MPAPPFFIVGAPRSGTTYLVEALNQHPLVLLTNEVRMMTFLNRVVNRLANDAWILVTERDLFLSHLKLSLAPMIEGFYRTLGADETTRWGDKNPHYADAKSDPECLDLINEVFPESQFINVIRDGRLVVSSLVARGWVDLDEAIDVWRRHVEHAARFAEKLGPGRFLTVRYENIVDNGSEAVGRILTFLDLPASADVDAFLKGQAMERTPFSKPTTPKATLGQTTWQGRLDPTDAAFVEEELADLLNSLGYTPTS